MIPILVVDSSFIVSVLIDSETEDGAWAEGELLQCPHVIAPHLLYPETANQLRKHVLRGKISEDVAQLAYRELLRLPLDLLDFESAAERVWLLRHNVTPYDAWYVALAELLAAPLATLDLRLVNATGPTCAFHTPPGRPTPH
jgi:predicted nucleic acid-binding protein